MKTRSLLVWLNACVVCVAVRAAEPALDRIADSTVWRVINRASSVVEGGGRKAAKLDARPNDGIAWLVGSDFSEGTLEVDLHGANKPQQSFVGLAFRGANETTYDAIYFRPFNFKNAEVERRSRSVQYVSMPQFPWEKLRADSPGKYEAGITPAPDPDDWFHARVVLAGRRVSVYVNGATTPALVVTELSDRRGGQIGLWVGNGSDGAFANLKVTPAK